MTLIKRTELQEALKEKSPALASQLFLFFGERFLCREAADLLQAKLLAGAAGAVNAIDGDREDPGRTLSRLMNFSLLPGRQIFRVTDSRIFHSKTVVEEIWVKAVQAFQGGNSGQARNHLQSMAQAVGLQVEGQAAFSEIPQAEWQTLFGFTKPGDNLQWADQLLADGGDIKQAAAANIAERYIEAFEKGVPKQNVLILTAETVDKRQKLFTYLKKHGTVVDCSVAVGASAAAQTEQKEVLREMMQKTLTELGKKIEPRAVELFFERVGFHPVAVVVETEKLAHYISDRPMITAADVEEMVSRNREDALYELTDALGKRQADRLLTILSHLLEQGIHELAILSTLRNYLKKQLIFRSLQMREFPAWRSTMNARDFQNTYLPALKAEEDLADLLQGHPYALFMSFSKASEYSCAGLKRWMSMLLDAEFRLKGSPLPSRLVIEELLLAMAKGSPKVPGRGNSVVY
ncbi:MAG: DNA polymerase III subunit delta [Desulforhopalus sp.]|nr:DNA polymerase III subunit delta [Desulforhopalus sp.]